LTNPIGMAVWLLYCAAAAASWQRPSVARITTNDLVTHLSASEYVAVVTLEKFEFAPRAKSPSEEARIRAKQIADAEAGKVVRISVDMPGGAYLYTLRVSELLCRQSDFRIGGNGQKEVSSTAHVVVPWVETGWDSNAEVFLPGTRYLVFFERDAAQKRLSELYQVDGSLVFYRAHLRSSGVIPLPLERDSSRDHDASTSILSATRDICGAVRPMSAERKIANLSELLGNTTDPGLRKSIQAAIGMLTVSSQER